MSAPSGTFANLADLGTAATPEQAQFVSAQTIPNVTFNETKISPPSNLYVAFDDLVFIQVTNSNVGVLAIEVRLRVLTPDGQIKLFVLPLGNLNSFRGVSNGAFQVDEGFILSAIVTVQTGSSVPHRGETFVVVALQRPGDAASKLYQQFISDYISSNHDPAWPGGQYVSSTEGPGHMFSQSITSPAPGADIFFTVPTSARWRLVGISASFGAGAAVANRNVSFILDDGVILFHQAQAPVSITAGQAAQVTFAGGVTYGSGVGLVITLPAPAGQVLLGGWRIRSSTQNIQPADAWTNIRLVVEEWIEV